ncbi:SIMPL domain-containing protein [candidate division WOR-3 bacterium]|nr:SIMPL domain-containing protein [candidate division WOR-3 bacterium]
MKKALIAVLAVLVFVSLAGAQTDTRSTLYVTGTAEVTVTPDICYLSLAVETFHKEIGQAYTQNNDLTNKVKKAIKEKGVENKDMQTTGFYISPIYDYDDYDRQKLIEYSVSHYLTVKIRDLDKVPDILDAAVKAGATSVDNVSFTVENPKEYTQEARQEAIKAARKKAEILAQLNGVTLGKPISISEAEPGGYSYYSNYYPQASMAYGDFYRNGGGAPLEQGEIKLTHTVYITYEIH